MSPREWTIEYTRPIVTDTDRERIITQITTYLSRVDDLMLGYLYGSFLIQDDFHDIDIGIVISRDLEPYESFRYAMEIASGIEQCITPRFPVDLRIINDAPTPFLYEVVRTGRPLYCRDEETRTAFEAEVISRYLDEKPLHERMSQNNPAPVKE